MYPYQTKTQVRTRTGLTDTTKYPDALIDSLIKRTSVIIDSYLGYSPNLKDAEGNTIVYSDEVLITPNFEGGLHVQLPHRFLVNILTISVKYGFNITNLGVNVDDLFIANSEGFFDIPYGACREFLFDEEDFRKYKALVTYNAGFDPLPDDLIELFYWVFETVLRNYQANLPVSGDVTQVSDKVKKYSTLNESMEFVDEKLSMGKLLDLDPAYANFATNVLKKYRLSPYMSGIFM